MTIIAATLITIHSLLFLTTFPFQATPPLYLEETVQNRLTKWETNVPETGKGQRGQHWHWRSPLQNPKAVATARSSDGRTGGISCQTFLNSNSKRIADIIPPPLLSSALHNSVNICFVSAFSASRFSNRSTLNPRSWMPAQLPALLTHKTYTNIH